MTRSHAFAGVKARPIPFPTGDSIDAPGPPSLPIGSYEGPDSASQAPASSTSETAGPASAGARSVHADHRVLTEAEWDLAAGTFAFSPREAEVARRIFDDLRESEIAERLGISRHTVHTHIERLYRKAGVTSRSALVVTLFASLRAKGQFPSPSAGEAGA